MNCQQTNNQLKFVLSIFLLLNAYFSFAEYHFKNINTDQGLSSNSVNAIIRDNNGYLWIGTNYGLNRFDGYNMKIFKQETSNPLSLNNNYVNAITQDADDYLWIQTKGGFCLFDVSNESFISEYTSILKQRNIQEKYLNTIICDKKFTAHILESRKAYIYNHIAKKTILVQDNKNGVKYLSGKFDSKHNLWLTDIANNLYKIDSYTGKILEVINQPIPNASNQLIKVFVDRKDNLWLILGDSRLYFYNTKSHYVYDFKQKNPKAAFNAFIIRTVIEDNYGKIWIATDHGGISLVDVKTFEVSNILENEKEDNSLSENTITTLFSDRDGIVWVGTFKQGVDYYHPSFKRFKTLKIPGSRTYNDINCFAEDKNNNLYIGTNGKGLYKYIFSKDIYEYIPYNKDPLQDKTIVSLLCDSKNRVWIGTYLDGLYCIDGNKINHYSESKNSKPILPNNNVWSLLEDKNNRIWIGTLNSGLYYFDEKLNQILPSENNSTNNYRSVECAFKDNKNELFFGTSVGVYSYDANGKFKNIFKFNRSGEKNEEQNFINSITQDKKGYFWVATQSGLAILKKDKYKFIGEDDGLGNKFIYMVLVDSNNNIWASTSSGLFMIKVLDYGNLDNIKTRIISFGKEDGLQDSRFNAKSALITRNNYLVFGGVNGYNLINPKEIKLDKTSSRIILTNLYVDNEIVLPGEKITKRVILTNSLANTSDIILNYNQNSISIGFTALNFVHPEKIKYEYQLKGFDNKWVTIDYKNPTASFNNLSRGDYVFNVRIKAGSGYDDNPVTSLKIQVLPPFWNSWPAYLIYFIIITSLIVFVYRYLVDRATFKLRIEQELKERRHVEEISSMKVKFFTNLSHELRTPVSLIILPVENLISKTTDTALKNSLTMVLRNAKRLLFIVNQLLDFRKLEVGEISYHPVSGNIVSFIKDVTLPFMDISQNKNIQLTVVSNIEELFTTFDPNKLERILFNLLSNAFKYTPGRGKVEVSIIYNQNAELPVKISVKDTGIGIDKEKLPHIFDRFYQADNQGDISNMGTGIGLSITYEFVKLHKGKISVESEPDKGTTFMVELPVDKISEEVPLFGDDINETMPVAEFTGSKSQLIEDVIKKEKTILIVDDNDDFRFYLVENLRRIYNVIEANNGKIAYEKANRFTPDIIVSDVTMPEMDGFELCKLLKNEVNTSHIPVILLTANTLDMDRITGYQMGADEYITKPFNVEVLYARIRNLLTKQLERHQKINDNKETINSEKLQTLDEKLLDKVVKHINENIENPDFSVDELCKHIGMSSVYLNKKISALTGRTTSEYIRAIRLKKAAQYLEKTDMSISEIAYAVGYNSPKYFSKYFKDEFGILPTEFRKNFL